MLYFRSSNRCTLRTTVSFILHYDLVRSESSLLVATGNMKMELRVIKCEGGYCTNKACSYGTPALSDVTTDDWKLIMAYLLRHDTALDQKLPITAAQAAQLYTDWYVKVHHIFPDDEVESQDLQDGGQDQDGHLDLPADGRQCVSDVPEDQDEGSCLQDSHSHSGSDEDSSWLVHVEWADDGSSCATEDCPSTWQDEPSPAWLTNLPTDGRGH